MPMIHRAAEVLFWVCAALVVYPYVVYPIVLSVLRKFRATAEPRHLADAELPLVSILIAAHNEEAVIRSRIANLLELDYPREKLELVIASDASRDATAAIVREHEARGVTLFEFTTRTGKAAVLNASIPRLKGEVVVLSDANTMMDAHALRNLVRWFTDSDVGVVCGKLILTDPVTGRNVDSLYWRYETWLKRYEGQIGGLLGANGGIYAVRRSLFAGIPGDTIVDDFVLPLLTRLRTGCRIVYDETAIAYEETPPEMDAEFRRRARIGAGGFQSIALLWPLLNPGRGAIAFTFFSHKVLRWLCPFFLLGAAAANLLLVNVGIYGATLMAFVALCAMALTGHYLSGSSAAAKVTRLVTMFATMNAALLVGFFRWAKGTQRAAWERTAR
jgi:cellulose synthase/poly-beta-1,6-N-acetylglucosamine synthase-like glycosyltransferase